MNIRGGKWKGDKMYNQNNAGLNTFSNFVICNFKEKNDTVTQAYIINIKQALLKKTQNNTTFTT